MTARSRAAVLATAALGGTLLLSGCGTSNVAAVAGDRVITQDDVAQARAQYNAQNFKDPQSGAPEQLSERSALWLLIIAPTVIDAAAASGATQSADATRTQFTVGDDISDAAVLARQGRDSLLVMNQASGTKAVAALKALKVSVNPQYGTFSLQKGISPISPAWVLPTAASTTTTVPQQ